MTPPGMLSSKRNKTLLLCAALVAAALAAYSNHFHNTFHFDDSHAILDNVYIESLRNIPRFFTGAAPFSSVPEGRTWRPVVSTSLVVDYWLARGRNPFFFHLSTFVWFSLLLVLLFLLFRRILSSDSAAGFAAALFALHPVCAETVNYIIQRGDLYNTLGVVASLFWFIAYQRQRKYGLYLIPALLACLSKAPALIFPFILLSYVLLFERRAWRGTIPAFVVTAAAALLTAAMTPRAWNPGSLHPVLYRCSQPWISLHYFKSFFWPTGLSADPDWTPVASPLSPQALAGYLFIAALMALTILTARRPATRPIAFGIVWFLLALLPTALTPLSDVMNDHRMFFAFPGLCLAAICTVNLLIPSGQAVVAVCLIPLALATHHRNEIWRTEESLWRDVTLKSPRNGRGWMNYGNVFLARGDYQTALANFQRAESLNPDYGPLQINLANACAGLHRDPEAVGHYLRAQALLPNMEDPYLHYGRWLRSKGRLAEAEAQLRQAVRINRLAFQARDQLSQILYEEGKTAELDRFLEETVTLAFDEQTARRYMAERARRASATPEAYVNLASQYCKAGQYAACLDAARKAIALRPAFAEAYNNMAVAWLSMQKWDEGIAAARQAIALKPDYDDAKSNLAWALAHRPK